MSEVTYVLEDKLKEWFGFETFKRGQKEIIESILAGKHTLGILPTGSEKFMLPTSYIFNWETNVSHITVNFFNGWSSDANET